MADKIISGILIIVIAALIIAIFSGVFSSPKIVRTVNNDGIFCPTDLSHSYKGDIDFKIKLPNKGSNGNMIVSINSPEFLVKGKPSDNFNEFAIRSWFVDSGEYQDFDFELLKNDSVLNASVKGYFKCGKIFCQKQQFCCNYFKERIDSSRYDLIDEKC